MNHSTDKNDEERKRYLREYQRERNKLSFTCDCGCVLKISNKHKHLKTDKHINKMELMKLKMLRPKTT